MSSGWRGPFIFGRGSRAPEEIAYKEVTRIGASRMNPAVKAAIIGGAVVGALTLWTAICYWSGSCVS